MSRIAEVLTMGGFGLYVWSAVGMTFAALLAEVLWLRLQRRTILRRQQRWQRLEKRRREP